MSDGFDFQKNLEEEPFVWEGDFICKYWKMLSCRIDTAFLSYRFSSGVNESTMTYKISA